MVSADELLEIVRRDGVVAALEVVAAIPDEVDAADAHNAAMMKAYWDRKDLDLVVAFGLAGLSRVVTAWHRSGAGDGPLRAKAAALAYNLASCTWPGWDEEGIVVRPAQAALGLDAARVNAAWAEPLGDLKHSRARWMLGAHQLFAGRGDEALSAFEDAARAAHRAGERGEGLLAEAFAHLTRLTAGEDAAQFDLDAAMEALAGEESGELFVEQVRTARRLLGEQPVR